MLHLALPSTKRACAVDACPPPAADTPAVAAARESPMVLRPTPARQSLCPRHHVSTPPPRRGGRPTASPRHDVASRASPGRVAGPRRPVPTPARLREPLDVASALHRSDFRESVVAVARHAPSRSFASRTSPRIPSTAYCLTRRRLFTFRLACARRSVDSPGRRANRFSALLLNEFRQDCTAKTASTDFVRACNCAALLLGSGARYAFMAPR